MHLPVRTTNERVIPKLPRQPAEIFTHALTTNQIAKNVFALHGVDAADRACLVRPSVRRDQLLEMVAKLPPCTIGMEACSGAHNWARHVGRCSKEGGIRSTAERWNCPSGADTGMPSRPSQPNFSPAATKQ